MSENETPTVVVDTESMPLRSLLTDSAFGLGSAIIIAIILATLAPMLGASMGLNLILLTVAWIIGVGLTFIVKPSWKILGIHRILFSLTSAVVYLALGIFLVTHFERAPTASEIAKAVVALLPKGASPSTSAHAGPASPAESPKPQVMPHKTGGLPLSITALSEPDYARYSGLDIENGHPTDNDPPMLGIGNVFISNTSPNEAVTLQIFLVVEGADGTHFRLDSEGTDAFGRQLGKNDVGTKIFAKNDIAPHAYILSPITIKPQETVHGSIPFIINFLSWGREADRNSLIGIVRGVTGEGAPKYKYVLEITDVISKKTIRVPVPSKGYP